MINFYHKRNDIRKRWTEFCTERYNNKLKTDANVLKNEDKLEREPEEASAPKKKRKSNTNAEEW